MKRLPVILSLWVCTAATLAQADPASELAGFSVFDKVDIPGLAKSDVKTMHGPPMSGRYLSVQSCYVMPGSPAQQIEALTKWNPTRHKELKVFLHSDLPGSPAQANFSKLKDAPDNGAVRALAAATQKMSSDLQISKDEEKKFAAGQTGGGGALPGPVADFWSNVLVGRAKAFISGGTAAQSAYDHGSDKIRPNDEIASLLKQQDKIRKQFAAILGETGIGRGAGSIKPDLYWELLDVDGNGVVTLGASYAKATGEGRQVAEVLYYASGGFYVALTFYQMWPVSVDGKSSTLVWRGDMISSTALESLHGVERLGSESAMMKDISKAITLFRKDTAK